MCTKNLKEISGPKFAWKVVKVDHYSLPEVESHVYGYPWHPNKTHFPEKISYRAYRSYPSQDQIFHCLATRAQARHYRARWDFRGDTKIIKLKLTGRVFEGVHSRMGSLDDKPAICGTEAYWDGKFHR